MKWLIRSYITLTIVFLSLPGASLCTAAPSEKDVLSAMKKASEFMVNEFSYRGGYCETATEDLSEWWNEPSARRTQIFVQGGTPPMGTTFLKMYNVTGDEYYLKCAEKAANVLGRFQRRECCPV